MKGQSGTCPLSFFPKPIAQSDQEESLRPVPTENALPSLGPLGSPTGALTVT